MIFAQIQLIIRLEGLDAGDQGMRRVADFHPVRLDGRMGEELAAQHGRESRRLARRTPAAAF